MRYFPWANVLILVLAVFETATGYFGLTAGAPDRALYVVVHRVVGFAVVLVLFWKGQNALRPFLRHRRQATLWTAQRVASIGLSVSLLVVLALGVWWAHVGPFWFQGLSGVSWHIYIALALVPLLVWHTVRYRRALAPRYWAERRAFLRLSGLFLGGLIVLRSSEGLARLFGSPGPERRFTGSYEAGSFSGNAFPTTSWLNDAPTPLNSEEWRLRVDGVVQRPLELTLSSLAGGQEPVELTATLDCTGGWCSTQRWRGVPLAFVLDQAGPLPTAASVSVVSVTGYYRRFGLDEARGFLLATHVGDGPLSHGHGFPLRLAAPGKRGFEWVKWVTRIEVHETGKWRQPPLPMQ
jgi:DMSO/TMAO reductase YedYZ molybdopterin-dependent catalytic subunit